MRSAELARLAGVTVRALRHYHQVGVLAEPHRRANGYRSYDVHDLVRVLRIKRLASLGIALERMPALLDDTDDARGLLDELDGELSRQIEHLARQRELIATLREVDASPDSPPELAPFLAMFATGLTPDLARMDRDQSVLLAHLAGDEGMPGLTRFYERFSEPDLMSASNAIAERFGRLGPDSPEHEIDDLIETFVAAFGPVVEEFAAESIEFGGSAHLVSEYAAGVLNEQQRHVVAQLEARLDQARPGEVTGRSPGTPLR